MKAEMEKQLKLLKEENLEHNLKFVDLWVQHMRSKTNKEWSTEQKNFIDSIYENLQNFPIKE